jgi:hypothetical protein
MISNAPIGWPSNLPLNTILSLGGMAPPMREDPEGPKVVVHKKYTRFLGYDDFVTLLESAELSYLQPQGVKVL